MFDKPFSMHPSGAQFMLIQYGLRTQTCTGHPAMIVNPETSHTVSIIVSRTCQFQLNRLTMCLETSGFFPDSRCCGREGKDMSLEPDHWSCFCSFPAQGNNPGLYWAQQKQPWRSSACAGLHQVDIFACLLMTNLKHKVLI